MKLKKNFHLYDKFQHLVTIILENRLLKSYILYQSVKRTRKRVLDWSNRFFNFEGLYIQL